MNSAQYILFITIITLFAMAFMALEAFIPGISLAGIGAAALIAWSVYLCWNAFGLLPAVLLLIADIMLSFLLMRVVLLSMKKGRLSKTDLFLKTENSPVVPIPAQYTTLTPGTTGTAVTALRPCGIAEINHERVHVSAESRFISAGESLRVKRIEGTKIVVEPCSQEQTNLL